MARPLLITISFSHFCEKARWALEHCDVDFEEEGHLPLFHLRGTKARGFGRSTPVLVLDKESKHALTDSKDIVRWADSQRPDGQRTLFPEAHDQELEQWRARFDDVLGPHARRWAYRQLFDRPKVMNALFAERLGRAGAWVSGPFFRGLLGRAMNVTDKGAARSHEKLRALFDDVGAALEDRPFLLGDHFSAADLTFASLAAPIIGPEGYGGPFPAVADLSPDARATITAFREHPAGRHALRVYRECR